jgi:Chaperone of endosialidase
MKTTTLPLKNSRNRLSCPLALVLIPFALACFALAPQARAVCQEGCDLSNFNTFLGEDALISNTSGEFNTAIGHQALTSNTASFSNTAMGWRALFFNTTGGGNTATGVGALLSNTTGFSNTATGISALFSNTTGSNNIGLGVSAGENLTTGSNNIDIGNTGVGGESRTIRLGTIGTHTKTFIAGISGVTVPDGVGVIVGANGKLGTVVSSERFKAAIKPMDKASEAILALKPVTFHYKKELDAAGIPQFGLVAEDVEKVNPHLVARDEEGKPYSVRYEAVNAMVLNEFLKEHKMVQEQGATIERLQEQVQVLTAGLQKVNAQLQTSLSAQRLVEN